MKKVLKDCKVYCDGVCIGIADIELPEPNIVKLWPIMLMADIAKTLEEMKGKK
jgi:hypothetical protein